jgi:HEAT repeat protein
MPPERSFEELANALAHPEWDARFDALKELKHRDPEQALPLLLQALIDEDSFIRRSAINILAELRDRRAVEPLIALLEDEDFLVRKQTIEALGTLGDRRAIDALIGALVDPNGNPQILAAAVLTSFPASEVVQAFTRACVRPTQWLARRAAVFARGPWDHEQLVPLLLVALDDANWRIRWRAAEELARRKERRAIDPLLARLNDEHSSVRRRVIEALGQLDDERAIDPLLARLAEYDTPLRTATVKVLAQFESQKVAQAFERIVTTDPASEVRSALVAALESWSQERAVPLLLRALADSDPVVRKNAVRVLGNLGDRRATRPLIAALADEAIRVSALEALGKLGDECAIDPLLSHLFAREEGMETHLAAATALASFHTPVIAQTFCRVIEDPALTWLRSAVTFALGEWNREQSVPLLLKALTDEDRQVRWRAAEALAKQPDARAIPLLLATLDDEYLAVRCRAIEALGKTGDERVIEPLLKQLASKEKQVRIAAATALSAFHRPEVVQAFLTAFQEDPGIGDQVLAAFEQWRERQAIAPLVARLKTRHDQVRLIRVLARIYDDEQILALVQKIIDPQEDTDASIFLIEGKAMKWNQAVDLALERIMGRIEEG